MLPCPLAADWGNVADWAVVLVSLLAAVATVVAVVVALRASDKEHRRTLELRDAEWARQDAARVESAGVWAISFDLELRVANDSLKRLIADHREALKRVEPFEAFQCLNNDAYLRAQFPLLRSRMSALEDFQPEVRSRLLDVLSWWDRMTILAQSVRVRDDNYDIVSATDALATVTGQLEMLAEAIERHRRALEPLFAQFPEMERREPEIVEKEFQERRRALFDLSTFPRED